MNIIYYRVLFLFVSVSVMIFSFSSCDYVGLNLEIGNNTNSYREATDYLCSRVWIDEWYDSNDDLHRQKVVFYKNNTGIDFVEIIDRRGNSRSYTNNFAWDWYNVNYTSLRLKYGAGDYSFIDNMIMGGNRIDCLFDGEPAHFVGY